MYQIGIMQGRLTPVKDGKIQSFPSDNWQNEFRDAQKIGFTLIEWVLDKNSLDCNPILSAGGRTEIVRLCEKTGIKVKSICCDNFMELPLSDSDDEKREASQQVLFDLIDNAGEVGIHLIELPLIGEASLENKRNYDYMVGFFQSIKPRLQKKGMKLLLEISLGPKAIERLLNDIDMDEIQINYDTGNSAYWSFDTQEEFEHYSKAIGNVHIKDCTPKDYSVELGLGNVDFDLTFDLLRQSKYRGDFILQTVRGENDIDTATRFFEFTKRYVSAALL